ncbi:helix-turn-helix domain-containing protein [Tissierella praeacuta]|uniref:helix-turn-helix domain-containing protein n=1 Tax=Tissierella praeacuta TaxID=43131 RepID=UPI0028AE20E3|nr:helix-turn-helix domain-containing protein [Tissierella praeacuta]
MFSKIFKELREEKNITQKDLAKQLNVTDRLIRYYETGERMPPADILGKIADFFDVSVDYLLGRTTTKKTMPSTENSCFLPVMEKLRDYNITNKAFININDIKNLSPQNQARIADYIEILKLLENRDLDSKK